jgi:hypothetical protein
MVAKPQFSLRWIFVAMAVVGLLLGEAVAFPGWIALTVGMAGTSFLPVCFVAGIVYARAAPQAFCIGALVWLVVGTWIEGQFPMMRYMHLLFHDPSDAQFENLGLEYRLDYCVVWSMTLAGGLVAVVVRWLTLDKPREGE